MPDKMERRNAQSRVGTLGCGDRTPENWKQTRQLKIAQLKIAQAVEPRIEPRSCQTAAVAGLVGSPIDMLDLRLGEVEAGLSAACSDSGRGLDLPDPGGAKHQESQEGPRLGQPV